MNHYAPPIRDYLLHHKSLSLEKIGTLTIDEKTSSPHHLSGQFHYDKKASTSPELITYIAERTGKSKVLIESDIESYTETMRQLMNIGKPYEIEGIGEYKLAQTGEYEFSFYEMPSGKEEHKAVRKQPSGELMPKKRSSSRNALLLVSLIIILGILGVVGWGTYNFFVNTIKNRSAADDSGVVAMAPPVSDTSSFITTDSITSRKDTAKNDTTMVVKTDTADYKFIYETTLLSERATRRTNQLIHFGQTAEFDSIPTGDGQLYRLYIKKRLANADTTRERDFLERYLQRSIQIVPAN